MSLTSWIRSLAARRLERQHRPHRRKPKQTGYRPRLELLEDRTLPSTVTWIGGSGDWDTAGNWSTGALPGATDDVVIGSGVTVTHASNVADSVNSVTSQSALSISSGSLSIAAASTIAGSLTVGGSVLTELSVATTLTVAGSVSLTGGTVNGGGVLTAADGGMLDTATLDAVTLVNPAGQTLILTGYFIPGDSDYLLDGAKLENYGTINNTADLAGSPVFDGTSGAEIDNYGLFEKTAGAAMWAGYTAIEVPFYNHGEVVVDQGSLIFGYSSQLVTIPQQGFTGFAGSSVIGQTGTAIEFGENCSLDAGSSVNGDLVAFGYSGVSTVAGSWQANQTSVGSGTTTFTNTSVVHKLGALGVGGDGYSASLDVSAATLDASARTLDSLVLAGTLRIAGDLTVNGQFVNFVGANYAHGTLQAVGGPYTLTAAGGTTLFPYFTFDGYTLVNPVGQTVTLYGGSGPLSDVNLIDGAKLENYGTLDEGQDYFTGDTQAAIDNYGTLQQYSGSATTISITLNNYGTIDLEQGQLVLGFENATTTGYANSIVTAALGTELQVLGTSTFAATSSLSADWVQFGYPGTTTFAGTFSANTTLLDGIENFAGSQINKLGNLDVSGYCDFSGATLSDTARTLSSLSLDGILLIAGDLTVNGQFVTNSNANYYAPSRLQAVGGPYTLTAAGGATIGYYSTFDGYTLVNPVGQTATLQGAGFRTYINLIDGAKLENYGTLYMDDDNVQGDAQAVIDNYGTFQATDSGGISNVIVGAFQNEGTITLNAGELSFSGGSFTGSSGSTISAAAGTQLGLADATNLRAGSSLAGDSVFLENAIVAGSFSANSTDLAGMDTFTGQVTNLGYLEVDGTADVSAAQLAAAARTLTGLFVDGGTLIASGNFTVNGRFDSLGTTTIQAVGGTATLTVNDGGQISGANAVLTLDGYTLINPVVQGIPQTITLNTVLSLEDGAQFENYDVVDLQAGGGIDGDASTVIDNVAGATFNFQGNVSVGNNGSMAFANAGTVRVSGGTVVLAVDFTNSGTVQVLSGGLEFNGYGSDSLLENGSFTATGASLTFNGGQLTFTAASSIQADSVTFANAQVTFAGSYTVNSTVVGLNAAVDFTGPHTDLGTNITLDGAVTYTGDFTQAATDVLNVGIGGGGLGQFGELNVTGYATFNGTINVGLVNGYIPPSGSSYEVLSFRGLTQAIPTMNGLQPYSWLTLAPVYDVDNLTLVANGSPSSPVITLPPPDATAIVARPEFVEATSSGPSDLLVHGAGLDLASLLATVLTLTTTGGGSGDAGGSSSSGPLAKDADLSGWLDNSAHASPADDLLSSFSKDSLSADDIARSLLIGTTSQANLLPQSGSKAGPVATLLTGDADAKDKTPRAASTDEFSLEKCLIGVPAPRKSKPTPPPGQSMYWVPEDPCLEQLLNIPSELGKELALAAIDSADVSRLAANGTNEPVALASIWRRPETNEGGKLELMIAALCGLSLPIFTNQGRRTSKSPTDDR